MDNITLMLLCLFGLVMLAQATCCIVQYFRVNQSKPDKIAKFTEEFIALNIVQYVHVNMNRFPLERENWQMLLSHMRSFVKARGNDKVFYKNLGVALHLYGNLPLSSNLHRLIDEVLLFANAEAASHGIDDLNIVDGVKLCKKITSHPLLA